MGGFGGFEVPPRRGEGFREGRKLIPLKYPTQRGNTKVHTKGIPMPLLKTTVTIPEDLLAQVDKAAERRGESRSRYITRVLRAAGGARRDAEITSRLNALFAEDRVLEEQRRTTRELQAASVSWEDDSW